MMNGRKDHCMEVLAGGMVCVFGGYEVEEDEEYEEEPVLEVETLGPRDADWSGIMNVMLPIRHAASCASTDGSKVKAPIHFQAQARPQGKFLAPNDRRSRSMPYTSH